MTTLTSTDRLYESDIKLELVEDCHSSDRTTHFSMLTKGC